MSLCMNTRKKRRDRGALLMVIIMTVLLSPLMGGESHAAKPEQKTFSSPSEAVKTMVDAMKEGNAGRLSEIFGPAGRELFSSGDDAADRQTREEFVKAYEAKNKLETVGKRKMILHVGKEDWSWPIPIVKRGKGWCFDTKEGKQEILARRIGENELAAIQVCLAYVDAQREYAEDHQTGGLMEYARKFMSDPGKTDGLCWEESKKEKQSPLGPFVAYACKESYTNTQQTGTVRPYHGYLYRILRKQGKDAPGGAYDYMVKGKMIGGFALVAYPARYGSSGIMTFMVNHDGVVYEKDLGMNTEKLTETMASFDPDKTWKKVE